MTPALKAMIDAMGQEVERQTEEQIWRPADKPTMLEIGLYAGEFSIDLEKVARAALLAIDTPDPEHAAFRGHDQAAPQAVHDLVRAYAGEGPRLQLGTSGWLPHPKSRREENQA